MEKDQLSRKLAVILHADVVGSTSLVQKDEALAHQRIRGVFNNFSKTIGEFGGVTHEIRGDALIAQFERASDAVSAALEFQVFNTETNLSIGDQILPELRIGISLGEVIVADDTMTGEGVVLAQRLEQLATPGGVVVQGSVAETIPKRLPFDFQSIGEQELKGFDHPVRAFAVKTKDDGIHPKPKSISNDFDVSQGMSQESRQGIPDSYEELTGERLNIPDRPSIAILPFKNISNDDDQEHFADGMTEDIITILSHSPDLIVIASTSSFAYKDRAVDVRQVGRELGVRHVLEGSIRKSGERIRITAQLIDAKNGDHVWAERYDREIGDFFSVQDEITQNIVIELHVKLTRGEFFRTLGRTNNLKAWELITEAGPLIDLLVREDTLNAKRLTLMALELDENYADAWVVLGWVYWHEFRFDWVTDSAKSLDLSRDAVQKALSLEPENAEAFSLLGQIHLLEGDPDKAIEMCKRAIDITPNSSDAMGCLGDILIELGKLEEGIQAIKTAIRLCPFPPGWYSMVLGAGLHLLGNHEAAIPAIQYAIKLEPRSYQPRVWLVSTLVDLGRLEEATAMKELVVDMVPTFSVANWTKTYRSISHSRLKNNLLAVGLPE